MEEKRSWKWLIHLLIVLALIGCGFFIGRKTIKIPAPKEIIEYITLPPIRDSIPKPYPVYITEPIDTLKIIEQCIADGIYQELWPEKTDTVTIDKTDTTAIMKDWATKRYYSKTLFQSDTLGTCIVDAELQYNRMSFIKFDYTPVQKNVTNTVYQVKAFSPFIGITGTCPVNGTRDFLIGATGGAFIKDKFGVQASYQHSVFDNTAYVGGGLLYKF